MKKVAGFLSAAIAVIGLSGCGGGGSDSYNDGLTTLFWWIMIIIQ
jgi:ABC-type glycerol-3-phosphate transport system substrate-binding protein